MNPIKDIFLTITNVPINGFKEELKTRNEYGRYMDILENSFNEGVEDLKTSACCDTGSTPLYIKETLKLIEPEIIGKFYGCGSPIPLGLKDRICQFRICYL